MEIGFFGFVVLFVCYLIFRKPVKAAANAANEGVAKVLLELQDPKEVTELKKKFGCDDPNVRSMTQLLDWVDKQ